ncbi:MAG: alpha-amylase, partial [Turicibacter sp.]|nr:alpha-amylase [Turicibacter sp.]
MSLAKLKNLLKSQIDRKDYNYWVPDLWNCWDFTGILGTCGGEIKVNPFQFYHDAIASFGEEKRPLTPLRKAAVYSMMIRTSTSWDHGHSGGLEDANGEGFRETGTFVKTLALLPLLRKMGITALYLLPISKFSLKGKKGDLGSPYAVQNFFQLDPLLKDPITGDSMTVEEEFSALVEACHLLGISVFIDIIPRTNSVNSDLIRQHPDWFYWIKESDLATYAPPEVEGLGSTLPPLKKYLPAIYESPEVKEHLSKFQWAPNIQDSGKWDKIVQHSSEDLLEAVRKSFGLVIAPAFSDHINDIQPAWTDVTFFRLFLDHPVDSQQYVDSQQPPYVLFDTVKASYHEGREPNLGLWELLADIIPYYQRNFNIDGARIDMGHALPVDLVEMIVNRARSTNPDFSLIAEELDRGNAGCAVKQGYDMIIGDGFIKEPRVKEFKTHEFMYDVPTLPCPVFACGETHDTPRMAARDGGETLSKMLSIMNFFLPGGIPFINSGQEVYEVQPMNMGLDCYDGEQRRLPQEDPYFGKLALFDRFALHYLHPRRWDLPDNLEAVAAIRSSDLDTFTDRDRSVPLGFDSPTDPAIGFGFAQAGNGALGNAYAVVASTDMDEPRHIRVDLGSLREKAGNQQRRGRLLYS